MFKAIIFDLDGTTVPNKQEGLPSERLISVVQKAKESLIMTVATGRPISNARAIIKKLRIESPCLISGGSQIIDPVHEKTLWEKTITAASLLQILEVAKSYNYTMLFDDELLTDPAAVSAKDKTVNSEKRIIYIMNVQANDSASIIQALETIAEIKVAPVPSWTPGCIDIHITHKEATKKQGLQRLFQILGVKNEEVIGIGDANNDLPLFESVGYKIAMGNGTQELKSAADFVAPTIEEDGAAVVIEKIINGELHV